MIAILAVFVFAAGQASALTTSGGGLTIPGLPKINDVICLSGCEKLRQSSRGGTVQISGTEMLQVAQVSFAGKSKRVLAEPSSKSESRIEVQVPAGAVSGKVRVLTESGSTSAPSSAVLAIGAKPETKGSAPLRVSDASTSPNVAYRFGKKRPRLNFILSGGGTTNDLRVDIVSSSGDVAASRVKRDVPSGSSQKVSWNGKGGDGKFAGNGRYRFVIRSLNGTAAVLSNKLKRARRQASRSNAGDPLAFRYYGFIFPVRGPHTYGDALGAGRGHQGLDVLAKCGTPLVAARGGKVHFNSYQAGGAGHYIVINLSGTGGQSHVYMHLTKPSRFKVGSRVKTGQRIGFVGTTGRSTACHLHFEHWSAPGWYQGGTFLDPTKPVKRWDRYS